MYYLVKLCTKIYYVVEKGYLKCDTFGDLKTEKCMKRDTKCDTFLREKTKSSSFNRDSKKGWGSPHP